MESLPDETLINIYYQLSPQEVANLCLANSNLARFCNEKSVRITALKNLYRQAADSDYTFASILSSSEGEGRDLERVEALLDLHPEWLDSAFSLRSVDGSKTIYAHPLELAHSKPALILFLLFRGANPKATALLDWIEYDNPESKWKPVGLEPSAPELAGKPSILLDSSMYANPTLHLLCMQRGYLLSWSEFDTKLIESGNLDVLHTYCSQHPPADLSLLATFPRKERLYFPLLELLRSVNDYNPINRRFIVHLIDITIASYRPLQLGAGNIRLDLSALASSPPSTPFHELRQLDFLVGPLPPKVWGGGRMIEQLASLSNLQVTLPPHGMESAIDPLIIELNYYSGLGLVMGLALFGTGYTVEIANVMDRNIHSEDEGIPIPCLDTDYTYRHDPGVTILPHLLQYEFFADEVHTVQYEHPDFVVGFKLAVELNGVDPETVVRVIR